MYRDSPSKSLTCVEDRVVVARKTELVVLSAPPVEEAMLSDLKCTSGSVFFGGATRPAGYWLQERGVLCAGVG
jgi:hypothetical protein